MASPIFDEEQLPTEAILPVQFAALWQRRPSTPEMNLLRGVLEQAVTDLRLYRFSRGRARRWYRDAYRWLMSNDRAYVFSFVNVCEQLSLSPSAVRAQIMRGDSVRDDYKVAAA